MKHGLITLVLGLGICFCAGSSIANPAKVLQVMGKAVRGSAKVVNRGSGRVARAVSEGVKEPAFVPMSRAAAREVRRANEQKNNPDSKSKSDGKSGRVILVICGVVFVLYVIGKSSSK